MKKSIAILVLSLSAVVGCDDSNQVENCGNGVIDIGEDCDGDQINVDCSDYDFYRGNISCNSDCTINTTQCEDFCGDGEINGTEECDGNDGRMCEDFNLQGTSISCNSDCTINYSNCILPAGCNNGQLDEDEECDGEDLDSKTCESLGYYGGTLLCHTETCQFVESDCVSYGFCGDGEINGDEKCDTFAERTALENTDCSTADETLYDGGTVYCTEDCRYDTSGCGKCGDGILQSPEQCDTNRVEACRDAGYFTGDASCNDDCTSNFESCLNGIQFGSMDHDTITSMAKGPVENGLSTWFIGGKICGTYWGLTPDNGCGAYIAKIGFDGNIEWFRLIETMYSAKDVILESVPSTGFVYAAVNSESMMLEYNTRVVRYTLSGDSETSLSESTTAADIWKIRAMKYNTTDQCLYIAGFHEECGDGTCPSMSIRIAANCTPNPAELIELTTIANGASYSESEIDIAGITHDDNETIYLSGHSAVEVENITPDDNCLEGSPACFRPFVAAVDTSSLNIDVKFYSESPHSIKIGGSVLTGTSSNLEIYHSCTTVVSDTTQNGCFLKYSYLGNGTFSEAEFLVDLEIDNASLNSVILTEAGDIAATGYATFHTNLIPVALLAVWNKSSNALETEKFILNGSNGRSALTAAGVDNTGKYILCGYTDGSLDGYSNSNLGYFDAFCQFSESLVP
ncbi:MAG: hypothetical protein JXR95_02045 [Deltaproteobacteria bacterium]|nr:hypothetical protein [Deltaproteobacteria bacterium]